MTRHSILALAILLAGGGVLVSCGGDDPRPVPGGINGPARVDPDSEVNNPAGGQDD